MWWNYAILILCLLLVLRWWQLKRSIGQDDYDYRYYEEGPYGERPPERNWWQKIRDGLGF